MLESLGEHRQAVRVRVVAVHLKGATPLPLGRSCELLGRHLVYLRERPPPLVRSHRAPAAATAAAATTVAAAATAAATAPLRPAALKEMFGLVADTICLLELRDDRGKLVGSSRAPLVLLCRGF
jgi:hypothetical protein